MKGVQISFNDIIPNEYSNLFAGSGKIRLFDSIRKIASFYTDRALLEFKDEINTNTISSILKKFYLLQEERKQLSKKYESQVRETLLQVLNDKKIKNSIYSKVGCIELFNKYKINSLNDFESMLNNDDFENELNEVIHRIIIEELSSAIKQADYYKECLRYQKVMIHRFKSYGIKMLKFIAGKLTWNDIMKIGIWIIDKIQEFTTNQRVGKPTLFYFEGN